MDAIMPQLARWHDYLLFPRFVFSGSDAVLVEGRERRDELGRIDHLTPERYSRTSEV